VKTSNLTSKKRNVGAKLGKAKAMAKTGPFAIGAAAADGDDDI
jgi:hypothetical protein